VARGELVAGQIIGVEDREVGLRAGRPHIGEDQPPVLIHRICAVKETVLERAVSRLAGRLEDPTVDVEEPAVIAAADSVLADQTEFERGAAVWAVQFKETDGAVLVAECDEILAQDAQPFWQIAQILGEDHRLPEAPQILAAGSARSDPAQLLILGRSLAVVVGAEGGVQKRRSRCYCHRVSPLPMVKIPGQGSGGRSFTASVILPT